MPKLLKKLLAKSTTSDKALDFALIALLKNDDKRMVRSLLSNTQAVDLISGGVKVNALPERAEATVNHRISTDR